ncbi:FXYD protein 11 [Arapaima gigas]
MTTDADFCQRTAPVQVKQKMGRFLGLIVPAVLCAFFLEVEANPFVYNYERLRIGGLVITCLLVAGAVVVLLWNRCKGKKTVSDDSSQI